jgi:hypothetical protein
MDAESIKQQELLEKKKRRLERNRASARQCRKRKKEKKLMLRQQLAHLEADNLQLRLKLQVGHDTQNHVDQSAIITSKLNEMIMEGASELEIQKKIQELKERFSDYGRDRRSAIDFHIAQLRRCLQPTQTTRAILFIMSLAPKYPAITYGTVIPDPNDELMVLWHDLIKELNPDQPQRELMVNFSAKNKDNDRDPFHVIHENTENCNRILDRIVEIICNKNDSLDSEMANIQSILSPRQIAKFILWIDRNPACMQMLEALWPHITVSSSTTASSNEVTKDNDPPNYSSLAVDLYDESDDDSSESD